jgi:cytosine/adenosine deaminase-related metal-dependent hydrolase
MRRASSTKRANVTMRSSSLVFVARRVLTHSGELLDDAAIEVRRGVILGVLRSRSAVRRARASGSKTIDLGDVVLAPGFVNAHSHLELSGLCGRLPRDGAFADWIRALLAERRSRDPATIAGDVRSGADRLLASGTTCTGDIDSSGAVASSLRGHPLRLRLYREVLDAGDPARTSAALGALDAKMRRTARIERGLSPHAPYTVSEPLFHELARRARRHRWPLSIHWAETRDENEWLERGGGSMKGLLAHSPHKRGLDLIAEHGLLGPSTALIHGNHPARGDRERIGASGATLVHCPGTHDFFSRGRFDVEAWTSRGVEVALGTDSLASNDELDMRREMRLVRSAHRGLDPALVLDMATRVSARALGFEGRAGVIAPGAWADFVAHATSASKLAGVLDALTSAGTSLRGVWIGGRRVRSADSGARAQENSGGISEISNGVAE